MAISIWTQSCMSRIYPHHSPPNRRLEDFTLYGAGNETVCFQIGVHGRLSELNSLTAEATGLATKSGQTISVNLIDILYPELVPVHWHTAGVEPGDLEGIAPGFYPDPLLPYRREGIDRIQMPDTTGIWIRIRIPSDAAAGRYGGSVRVLCELEEHLVHYEVVVWSFCLPERTHFHMTNWLSVKHLVDFHRVTPMTDEFWRVLSLYARNLAAHRQNVIFTPLFCFDRSEVSDRHQLVDIGREDSGNYTFGYRNFDRWLDVFMEHGFELIEGSHLAIASEEPVQVALQTPQGTVGSRFTSTRGEDFRSFIRQYLRSLRSHLAERNVLDRFYLHISDEPKGEQLEPYAELAKLVKEIAPEFQLIDAMGHAEFASCIDHPVPLESAYSQFVGESEMPKEDIWAYYCCSPRGSWPNRFLDYPLIRVRIFTWIAFRYGIPGFLHWGLNYWGWHPPFYRFEQYNPYDNTTGGTLPPGDGYVLYPPFDTQRTQEPVDSIRWEIIRRAMDDYEYLYLLQGIRSAGGSSAAGAASLLETLETVIVPDFENHVRDENTLENFRRRAAEVIEQSSD